jgi:hypothetical protein
MLKCHIDCGIVTAQERKANAEELDWDLLGVAATSETVVSGSTFDAHWRSGVGGSRPSRHEERILAAHCRSPQVCIIQIATSPCIQPHPPHCQPMLRWVFTDQPPRRYAESKTEGGIPCARLSAISTTLQRRPPAY